MSRLLPVLLLALAACLPERTDYPDPDAGGTVDTTPTGLPCDVAQVFQNRCISCHSDPPTQSAPMPLVTYDQITADSAQYPGQSYAQRALARIQDPILPMPPGGGASAADVATLQAWVNAGTPEGSCDGSSNDGGTEEPDAGSDDADAEVPDSPPACTSGTHWTHGDIGSALMHPGRACLQCHSAERGAPHYTAAGTIFPTTHEPDDCNGQSGVKVTITDAAGHVYSQTSNQAGNFYFSNRFTFPIHASLTLNGRTREMVTAQTSADCNLCHTQDGTQDAPGRVVAP